MNEPGERTALPLGEAADRLGITPDALRMRLNRGKADGFKRDGQLFIYVDTAPNNGSNGTEQKESAADNAEQPHPQLLEAVVEMQRVELDHLLDEFRRLNGWVGRMVREHSEAAAMYRAEPPAPENAALSNGQAARKLDATVARQHTELSQMAEEFDRLYHRIDQIASRPDEVANEANNPPNTAIQPEVETQQIEQEPERDLDALFSLRAADFDRLLEEYYRLSDRVDQIVGLQARIDELRQRIETRIGLAYTKGLGVVQDDAEAARWFRKAADKGLADAQSRLGIMYTRGQGVLQDDVEAARLYRLAAEQGDVFAQANLGLMCAKGQGVPQDDVEASRWFRLAAEKGNVLALHNLGVMYAKGLGVPQDYAEAARLYRDAAEQGNAGSQYVLGFMYDTGRGVTQDFAEAVKWYRKAAEQWNARAQYNLGIMYAQGQGVPQDFVMSHMWSNLAAAGLAAGQNRDNAIKNRTSIEARMTPDQIAEAQRMAREWLVTFEHQRES